MRRLCRRQSEERQPCAADASGKQWSVDWKDLTRRMNVSCAYRVRSLANSLAGVANMLSTGETETSSAAESVRERPAALERPQHPAKVCGCLSDGERERSDSGGRGGVSVRSRAHRP